MINIQLNLDQIRSSMNGIPDLIEKATRSTMNNVVAYGPVKKEIEQSIRDAIPTANPFTDGSSPNSKPIYIRYPGSDRRLLATIGVSRNQAAYLQFMVKGVPRDDKIIERRFNGHLLLPTRAIKLDKYGNVPKQQFIDIVRNAKAKTDNYFTIPTQKGKQVPGIYQRREGKAVPMFWIVDNVNYRKQWDFFKVAEESIMRRLPDAMNEAIAKRLKDYQNGK